MVYNFVQVGEAEGYVQGQVGQTSRLVCLVAQEHAPLSLTYFLLCQPTSFANQLQAIEIFRVQIWDVLKITTSPNTPVAELQRCAEDGRL